mgnify:CR=1 FL=1
MRKNTTKKISIFWFIVSFLMFSYLSVFLINNIITVNKLIREISAVKDDLSLAVEINNSLKIEIDKLSSFDRIRQIAEENVGLEVYNDALIKDKKYKIQGKAH